MAHHDNHSHDHDHTEGKRQSYPQGWWIPLAGLVVVAIIFAFGIGSLLNIAGTDKWGKTAEDHGHGHEVEAAHHEGTHEAPKTVSMDSTGSKDSVNVAVKDSVKVDSPAPAEHHDAGH